MFAGMFWLFRVAVALLAHLQMDFMVQPLDLNVEIALLFVTFIALVLVIRRNMIGGLIYLISYALYFGIDLFNSLSGGMQGPQEQGAAFVSGVAMLLALGVFIDLSFSKDEQGGGSNKKTNWFYGTSEYTRDKDDRDDTNQYKF